MPQLLKIVIVALVASICYGQETTSLDNLIKNIFNLNSSTYPDPNINSNPMPDSYSTVPPQIFQPEPTKTTILGPINGDRDQSATVGKSCGYERECVKRFLCKNDTISTDGLGIIDIRINGEDCGYLEVCCDIPNKTTEPIIPIVPPEQHEGCGYVNPQGVGYKIVGNTNNEAEFGEFPWMCAILREEEAAGEILNLYECGGALIAPTVVITGAHCVQKRMANTLIVRAGEWDTQTKDEIIPHQDRHVKDIVIHENYNKGTLYNDVALLFVDEPFIYMENVRPICLPDKFINFDYSRCFATGWGKDKFGREGEYQLILKKIDLPVVPNSDCQKNLRTTRLGKYFNLHESFICAGGEVGKDTCKGDGGSPLVCPVPGVNGRYYQAGIVAWGIGCGEENIPGVYANVPYLRQWVDTKLQQRGIDFSHFTA